MRIAVISDIHAGIGANNRALRDMQMNAVKCAAQYVDDMNPDMLVLNGDTTDHLNNRLSSTTNPEIARDVLWPLVKLINERRADMETVVLAGNTDWPVAEEEPLDRDVFFEYTGLSEDCVKIPVGGLLHVIHNDTASLVMTHGHAFKPSQWGHAGAMENEDYDRLWSALHAPSQSFLNGLSATSGSHRRNYLIALCMGIAIKPMPRSLREKANSIVGDRWTAKHEHHYARMLHGMTEQTHKKILGVMGHTHVAGVRSYDNVTILNTGTTGAKPNPLQRVSDPKGHVAMIDVDDDQIFYRLVQTFNARRPKAAEREIEVKKL